MSLHCFRRACARRMGAPDDDGCRRGPEARADNFLYEQRRCRDDRRRDDERLEDAQRDVGGQSSPRPCARKYNGCQQPDEGQVLEAQQAHADHEGHLDDVHREEEPGRCPEKLGDRKARGQEVHGGHGSARVRRHRRETRERPVDGSSDAPLADVRRPPRRWARVTMTRSRRIAPITRRICVWALTARRGAPRHTPTSIDGTRRLRTAVFASRRYAHRAIASPMRSRASMTPVDSFVGRARAKRADAMRATQVRAVSVDRSMSIPCTGSIGGGGGGVHTPCLVRACQHIRGGSEQVASTPP